MTLKADNKGRTEEVDVTDINLFFSFKRYYQENETHKIMENICKSKYPLKLECTEYTFKNSKNLKTQKQRLKLLRDLRSL